MTAAVHEDTTNTANGPSFITSHSFDLPATVDAGDLLVALITINYHLGSPGTDLNTWTLVTTDKLHDYHVTYVYALIAAGTEDGGTVSFTTPTSCNSASQVLRFSGAYPSAEVGVGLSFAKVAARSWGTQGDPPSITAPWGVADNTFVAIDQFGAHDTTIITWPSGYSTNQSQPSGDARHLSASASKTSTATTDDPGVFATATATIHKGMTLVIRPADAGVDATLTPSGGLTTSGTSSPTFSTTSAPQVPSNIKLYWDLDNDGDFNETVEDVTPYAKSIDVVTGRDFPSQLTGKATPGRLSATLINSDDRFTVTNTSSPLQVDPFSLDTGRKIRVRISEATDPEPTLLLSDRHGTTGDLSATEQAEPWALISGGNVDVSGGAASPDTSGETIATTDVRKTELYAQMRVRHCDADNGVGLLYRFTNPDNYGLVRIQNGSIRHDVVSEGSTTNHTTQQVEFRPHMTFGVYINSDDDVSVWLEGVELFTDVGDAASNTGTGVGMWWDWQNHRAPEVEEIYAWDGLWSTSSGVLFTGDVTDIKPTITPLSGKEVVVTGEGWLRRLAGPEVTPPVSIGVTTESPAGVTSGVMVGQTLASADLLHPPPPGGLAAGDITLGGVGTGNAQAFYIARLFEMTELGFLYELPEGPIAFDSRSSRVNKDVIAAFSDAAGSQFGPETVELLDWRRELFNRASAEVSPSTPVLENILTTTGDHAAGASATISVTLPSGAQASAGDLDLVVVVPSCQLADEQIEAPTGWVTLSNISGTGIGKEHWFARTLTSGDFSDSVTFYSASTTGGGAWLVRQFIISGWYGNIESGVSLSSPSGSTGSEATAGTISQPSLLIPWGRQPCLIITTKSGMYTASSGVVSMTDPDDAPNNYRDLDADAVAATGVSTADVANAYAWKHASVAVESPSDFGGTFTGFSNLEASTVAIRGYAGDPPEETTGEIVTVDDLDSQARHNVISTFPETPGFFASTAQADTWCDTVLSQYSVSRPLFRIGFHPNKTSLHRWLAYTLRVSDLIRINATGSSGIGVNGLYHVESIRHIFSDGVTDWWCELEVSPSA
jgi:hypothetical protein